MDEPFSALDAITRERLQELLPGLLGGRDIVAVIVTHSVEEAVFLGQRVLLMGYDENAIIKREFANPGAGSAGYRSDPGYFRLSSEIRRELRAIDG